MRCQSPSRFAVDHANKRQPAAADCLPVMLRDRQLAIAVLATLAALAGLLLLLAGLLLAATLLLLAGLLLATAALLTALVRVLIGHLLISEDTTHPQIQV